MLNGAQFFHQIVNSESGGPGTRYAVAHDLRQLPRTFVLVPWNVRRANEGARALVGFEQASQL